MYIVLLLDEVFCRHKLAPFDLWSHLILGFLCWIFVWVAHLLVIEGYKVSQDHCVSLYVLLSPLLNVWWYLGTMTLGAYTLIIVISFWCIAPFISMKHPLSHLTNVVLKSTLSDVSIGIPAYFGGPLAW
jgi:hypothetical protein